MRFYECGICGDYHPWKWNGDCRDDDNRYTYAELNMLDLDPTTDGVEILTMTDRLVADGFYTEEEGERIKEALNRGEPIPEV